MRLLNDTPFMNNASYIQNGKEWGEGKTERESERERERDWIKCKWQSMAKKGFQRGS
jgi:hypothetical protein